MNTRFQKLSRRFIMVIIALAMVLYPGCQTPVDAKSSAIDPSVLALVHKLAANPELMNITYLQYIIGYPENGKVQGGLLKRSYYWYEEPNRFLNYRLDQEGPRSGIVTNSALTINLPDSNVKIKDVENSFGPVHSTVYDFQSHPTQVYRVSPTTYLVFTEPRNSFRVSNIKVVYQGPPLAPPSQEDMELAYNYRKSQVLLSGQNGDWHLAIPWLRAEVAKKPQDPEAHIKLGFAYRQHMMLNEAIAEYVEALKLSGNRADLNTTIIAALTEMRVWPINPNSGQPRTFIAGDSGQLGL